MWYYADGSNRQGPLEVSDIDNLIADGTVTAETLVWREGMSGWEAASGHFNMTPRKPAPPPVPQVPNAPDQPASPKDTHREMPRGDLGADGLYIHAPSRSFGEAISTCFAKFVTFKGRASRSEYWFWALFTILVSVLTGFIDAFAFPTMVDVSPLNSLANLIMLLPSLAVSFRRLHDTNRSGWWVGGFYIALIAISGVAILALANDPNAQQTANNFIPLLVLGVVIYVVVLIVFLCQRGTPGPNRFG